MKNKILILVALLSLSACKTLEYNSRVKAAHQERINLFSELSSAEISSRQAINLQQFDGDFSSQNSVISIIKQAIVNSVNSSSKYIPVDLRYYDGLNLGDTMFSAVADSDLTALEKFSKFAQQYFILINFSDSKVTFVDGSESGYSFDTFSINGNLQGKEIVFNVSNSNSVACNAKFTAKTPVFSFIADSIKTFPCDLREAASSGQRVEFNKATKGASIYGRWKMKLFSMNNAVIAYDDTSPKLTHGSIEYVMNQNVQQLSMVEFENMDLVRVEYYDRNGTKFKHATRDD
jgi:hypothetical protein